MYSCVLNALQPHEVNTHLETWISTWKFDCYE